MEREKPAADQTAEREPADAGRPSPETEERPAPGIKYQPEPDAENIMPAEDQPGTL